MINLSPLLSYWVSTIGATALIFLTHAHGFTRQQLGFRIDNFAASARSWLLLTGVMVLTTAALRLWVGSRLFEGFVQSERELVLLIPLYFLIGGPLQEFAFRGYLIPRLAMRLSGPWIILVGSLLFGLLHMPFYQQKGTITLILLSTIGGCLWTALYRRHPNVYWASISHAIVGTVALLLLQMA